MHDIVASSTHKNTICRILVKDDPLLHFFLERIFVYRSRQEPDGLFKFLRINSRGERLTQLISECVPHRLFLGSFPFGDDLQGGSLQIFYYHDVSRLIASTSFRSTFRKFPIHRRGFTFLPTLPFPFCKVGNESFNRFGCISPLYASLGLKVYLYSPRSIVSLSTCETCNLPSSGVNLPVSEGISTRISFFLLLGFR